MANEQAKAFVDQATQSLQNSQFQQALELVDQAIAIEPGASDSHVLRGICLSQLGQPDAATESFRKAIMLSPYNAKAYYNLAVHQNALGNKKEAAELAREAVGVDPRHSAARAFLTQLEQELSGPAQAPAGSRTDVVVGMGDPLASQPPPPRSSGAQDLPKPTASDMPHVSAAPGQPREAAQSAPPQSANPYAQQSGSQFSPAGYTRPGYDQPAHSLPWVERIGSGWVATGWILSALSLLFLVIAVFTSLSAIQAALSGATAASHATANYNSLMMSPLFLIGTVIRVLCFLWCLFDVIDRRTGWGWIVALVIVGCCCGFPWIIIPIYIGVGRK